MKITDIKECQRAEFNRLWSKFCSGDFGKLVQESGNYAVWKSIAESFFLDGSQAGVYIGYDIAASAVQSAFDRMTGYAADTEGDEE